MLIKRRFRERIAALAVSADERFFAKLVVDVVVSFDDDELDGVAFSIENLANGRGRDDLTVESNCS